jgi:phosphomethylpyrimidine synthase
MKITQDVRDYAATLNDPALSGVTTAQEGMAAMSDKFKSLGEQVYVDAETVKASNKVL